MPSLLAGAASQLVSLKAAGTEAAPYVHTEAAPLPAHSRVQWLVVVVPILPRLSGGLGPGVGREGCSSPLWPPLPTCWCSDRSCRESWPPLRVSGARAEPPSLAMLTLGPGCGSPGPLPGRCCYRVL